MRIDWESSLSPIKNFSHLPVTGSRSKSLRQKWSSSLTFLLWTCLDKVTVSERIFSSDNRRQTFLDRSSRRQAAVREPVRRQCCIYSRLACASETSRAVSTQCGVQRAVCQTVCLSIDSKAHSTDGSSSTIGSCWERCIVTSCGG